jgi:hypothetical protein
MFKWELEVKLRLAGMIMLQLLSRLQRSSLVMRYLCVGETIVIKGLSCNLFRQYPGCMACKGILSPTL